jgi:cardiolipin synthase A/B
MMLAACGSTGRTPPEGAPGATTTTGTGRPPVGTGGTSTLARGRALTTSATTTATHRTGGLLTLVTEPIDGITTIDRFLASPDHSLDLTMYELVDPTAEQILSADAARGVAVRVVLDTNLERTHNTPAYDYLVAHGVHVVWAPSSYDATHEKAAVVDAGRANARALIMTLNLTAQYYATTRDFAVVDTNPADITAMETVFDADYAGQSSAITPSGADLVWSPGAQTALVSVINSARASLAVENEEMGNGAVVDALSAAARRNVNVEVTMTADSEWDGAFDRLAAAGAHVRLYADTSSALYIHAKAIVADSTTAFVGSENFSTASLDYNRELGIVTTDPDIISGLSTTLANDYAGATPWSGSPITSTSAPTAPAASSPGSVPTTPASGPAAKASCYPLDNEGGCYEPGEYCRDDNHGQSGVAGNGAPITCEDKSGWLWEPS